MRPAKPSSAIIVALLLVGATVALADTPGTQLAVSPNTNLNPAGQSVQVSGTGFGPNASGTIQQCIPVDAFGAEDCSETIGNFTTNASGAFGPVPVTVSNTFTAGGTLRTCPSAFGPCTVFAAMNALPQNAHATITFSSGGTTTTTITIPPSTTSTSTTVPPTTTSTSTTVPPTTTSTSTTVPPTTTSSTVAATTTTTNPLICDGKTATIVGTSGNDTILGTPGPDVIVGLGGDDSIRGLGGDDTICGGDGSDQIDGDDGNDRVFGGNGNDRVLGGTGTDAVFGNGGLDQCFVTPTSTASTCEQVVSQP